MRRWSAKPSSASQPNESPAAVGVSVPSTADARWAGVQYDVARARSSRHGHVESWFLKANDPRGSRAVWLRWTIWASDRAPDRALAEAWAIAFGSADGHVATKTTVPFERASFGARGIAAEVDGCRLTSEAAVGQVDSGGRSIAYDLRIESLAPADALLPGRWAYAAPLPFTKVVSPMPNIRVFGKVAVRGETWALDAWPGMIGHNWGNAHAEPYAWGHCNAWDGADQNVVLEGFTLRPRAARLGRLVAGPASFALGRGRASVEAWSNRGGLFLPAMTALTLRYRGESYSMKGVASLARNTGSFSERRWTFRALGRRIEVAGEMWADSDDFVGLFYPQPDGSECSCLNTKLARAEITVSVAGRRPRTLHSERAALELATRDPHHGVRMYV
jgi:hypothetical protein